MAKDYPCVVCGKPSAHMLRLTKEGLTTLYLSALVTIHTCNDHWGIVKAGFIGLVKTLQREHTDKLEGADDDKPTQG